MNKAEPEKNVPEQSAKTLEQINEALWGEQ